MLLKFRLKHQFDLLDEDTQRSLLLKEVVLSLNLHDNDEVLQDLVQQILLNVVLLLIIKGCESNTFMFSPLLKMKGTNFCFVK